MSSALKAPFPWFGGKSRVADVVWRAFGDVPNYVEPFAGSLAVLLARPTSARIETVNDADCYLANFWRAVQHDPEAVAHYCDWPVNEIDLHARHRWLVGRSEFREQLLSDPEKFDAKIAGWWVWGLSMWIGGGWCAIGTKTDETRPALNSEMGVHRRRAKAHLRNGRLVHPEARPDLQLRKPTNKPGGVHQKRPAVAGDNAGRGVHRLKQQAPELHGQRGINTRLPSLGNERGIHGSSKPPCSEWFADLCNRLRRVRVVCGDWKRVCGDSVLGTTTSRNSGMNPCGLFLDPPYNTDTRDPNLYAVDSGTISAEVRAFAIEKGEDPDMRIALCGYEGEHEMPASWTCHAWKAHRGYGGATNDNKNRERIWFSPHCLPIDAQQTSLFAVAT